nr:hypothetical protein [Pseudomonas sp.]
MKTIVCQQSGNQRYRACAVSRAYFRCEGRSATSRAHCHHVQRGCRASTGTPAPILEKLGAALAAAVNDPQVAQSIVEVGAQPAALTPQAYRKFIDGELDKWAGIVKASGAVVV